MTVGNFVLNLYISRKLSAASPNLWLYLTYRSAAEVIPRGRMQFAPTIILLRPKFPLDISTKLSRLRQWPALFWFQKSLKILSDKVF